MTTNESIGLKVIRAVTNFFGSTQASFFLGALGMFGATSVQWGLSLFLLGVVIDILRAKYIFDWTARRFRPIMGERDRLSKYSDHNGRRYGRRIVILSIVIFSAVTIASVSAMLISSLYTTFFCETNFSAFSWMAEHLSLQTREIPTIISVANLDCRANFSRVFFSATFYILILWITTLYVFLDNEFTLFFLYKDYFGLKRDESLRQKTLKSHIRILVFFLINMFFVLGNTIIISNNDTRWNFVDSNEPFIIYTIHLVIIIYSMSFSSYVFNSQRTDISSRSSAR